MRFYGKEKQDKFAYYLIGPEGVFLDIGCYNPVIGNNTKGLEEAGWTGLLFDSKPEWIDMAKRIRKNKSFCVDTTSEEFTTILNENLKNKLVDYISLDVDEASIETLDIVVKSGVSFKCMTFEHCLFFEPNQKRLSKEILEKNGYTILFENVLVDLSHDGYETLQPFEDWWIDTKYFKDDILDLRSEGLYFEECVQKVMGYNYANRQK